MIKVLFLIPNLGHGGAEKVLVNLVNNLDRKIFDITVMSLYGEGVNRKYLKDDVKFCFWLNKSFPGISHLLKIFSPELLYKICIKKQYDIVVSYLEGQTARIISGCNNTYTKKVCWIHCTLSSRSDAASAFRSEAEAIKCYQRFDYIISVSEDVQRAFQSVIPLPPKEMVLYNINESDKIKELSKEKIEEYNGFSDKSFKICAMGSLIPVKGFERLINVHKKLKNCGYLIHTYILGEGQDRKKLERLINDNGLNDSFSLLGYQENPYKYLAKANLFVCSSYSEGFSTAVTEALILGKPVITTNVSGMSELLGANEYGIITNNNEESLFLAIKSLLDDVKKYNYYCEKAKERGKIFSKESTVEAVEKFLVNLVHT